MLPHVKIIAAKSAKLDVVDVFRDVFGRICAALADGGTHIDAHFFEVLQRDEVQRRGVEFVVEQVEARLVQREIHAVPLVEQKAAEEVSALQNAFQGSAATHCHSTPRTPARNKEESVR